MTLSRSCTQETLPPYAEVPMAAMNATFRMRANRPISQKSPRGRHLRA